MYSIIIVKYLSTQITNLLYTNKNKEVNSKLCRKSSFQKIFSKTWNVSQVFWRGRRGACRTRGRQFLRVFIGRWIRWLGMPRMWREASWRGWGRRGRPSVRGERGGRGAPGDPSRQDRSERCSRLWESPPVAQPRSFVLLAFRFKRAFQRRGWPARASRFGQRVERGTEGVCRQTAPSRIQRI